MPEAIFDLPWWGYVLIALAFTHVTIISVTVYLHRHQAHLAVTLHPLVSHFFRLWLWVSTAMNTKEWIAVHRKHHANVEQEDDPHSPQVYGIHRVLWLGALLYHKQSRCTETLEKYGYGAPNDWIERALYTPYSLLGPIIMLLVNVLLFGVVAGFSIWLVQMVWIPFWAAGVINGIGHFWGYRNYELSDASRNIVPWGLIIGGEELHNNHHAFASSAKFSTQKWELDLGWMYLCVMRTLGLAKVRKTAPVIVLKSHKQHCDLDTVKAVLGNRFQVMANFVREVLKDVCREEMRRTPKNDKERWALVRHARSLMAREQTRLDAKSRTRLEHLLDASPNLSTVYAMQQRLRDIWNRSTVSQEHLLNALEEWCRSAEESGIEALREFSQRLRGYTLAPAF